MTDPSALLAQELAQELEVLRTRLSECEASVRMVSKGASSEIDEVKTAIIDLIDQVAALQPSHEEQPAPPKRPPVAWVDHADSDAWTELASWVDWLIATYEVRANRAVLPCWPAHRGVAEELAALWQSWKTAAVTVTAAQPSEAMIVWHERHLWPALARFREYTAQFQCHERHKTHRPGEPTSPELLAAALASAPIAGDGAVSDDEPPTPLHVVS